MIRAEPIGKGEVFDVLTAILAVNDDPIERRQKIIHCGFYSPNPLSKFLDPSAPLISVGLGKPIPLG